MNPRDKFFDMVNLSNIPKVQKLLAIKLFPGEFISKFCISLFGSSSFHHSKII